jgi:hypothetical protein
MDARASPRDDLPGAGWLVDVLAPSTSARGRGLFCARARPTVIETAMGQTQLARRSSNLTSKHGETREQGRDYPPNKRTILGHPLQHGEQDGEWELRTHDSAGQSFALSGRMAMRGAQTSAPEARMGLLPQAPDVAVHRREVTRRWREHQRALKIAATARDEAAQPTRGAGTGPASEAASA